MSHLPLRIVQRRHGQVAPEPAAVLPLVGGHDLDGPLLLEQPLHRVPKAKVVRLIVLEDRRVLPDNLRLGVAAEIRPRLVAPHHVEGAAHLSDDDAALVGIASCLVCRDSLVHSAGERCDIGIDRDIVFGLLQELGILLR